MMTLEDFRPSQEETDLTEDMPEQVAIGYIRARRKDQMAKRRHQTDFSYLSREPRGFA